MFVKNEADTSFRSCFQLEGCFNMQIWPRALLRTQKKERKKKIIDPLPRQCEAWAANGLFFPLLHFSLVVCVCVVALQIVPSRFVMAVMFTPPFESFSNLQLSWAATLFLHRLQLVHVIKYWKLFFIFFFPLSLFL